MMQWPLKEYTLRLEFSPPFWSLCTKTRAIYGAMSPIVRMHMPENQGVEVGVDTYTIAPKFLCVECVLSIPITSGSVRSETLGSMKGYVYTPVTK